MLNPATLATMFEPHYQPDPRLPGMGLGFVRYDAGGHLVVGHDGTMPGFNAQLFAAPEDGVGVIAFTNGSEGAVWWLPTELSGLPHYLLDVPRGRAHRCATTPRDLEGPLRVIRASCAVD